MTSPHSARKASAAVRQAGAAAIQLMSALSAQPAAASTRTIVKAAAFHAMAEPRFPKRWPVSRSSRAQKDVVKPAIARCECATRPWVNFSRSSTPGRKARNPVTTSSPHHSKVAMRQPCGLCGQRKWRQSVRTSHGQGSSKPRARIWRASAWLPPIDSAMPNTTHDAKKKPRVFHGTPGRFASRPQARGNSMSKATTTSVEPSRLAPVGPPVLRSTGG